MHARYHQNPIRGCDVDAATDSVDHRSSVVSLADTRLRQRQVLTSHRKSLNKWSGRSSSGLVSLDTLTRRFSSLALRAQASARFQSHTQALHEKNNPSTKGNGESGEGVGCTQFVQGRSRMSIGPCILTMSGRSTSGFHQPGRHCMHQARSAVTCSASPMKGELHPSKNRS